MLAANPYLHKIHVIDKNFDDDLINKQIELQDFSEKSIVRKEEILEN